MSNIPELLRAEFEALKNEIIAAYEGSGMMASGNWPSNLEVDFEENGVTITAADYINGRGPGQPPPSEAIEAWLKDTGIASRLDRDMSTQSLAYLIARKIGREGWKPKPGSENIVESVATPERIQQILDKVGEVQLEDFTADIINYLKAAL